MSEMTLRSHLLAQSAITDLIGQRLYPERFPQGATFPAVTYQRVFGAPEYSHEGDAGLARERFQLDCWGNDYADVVALAGAIRTALGSLNGARIVNTMDVPEPDVKLRRRMIDVTFWHNG